MQKALLLYGSTGGNTAFISLFVQEGLQRAGYEVHRFDVKNAPIDDMLRYDLIVLGASTWDGPKVDGLNPRDQHGITQGRLQVDMRLFVEKMKDFDFKSLPMAVFGVGHHSYTFVCNAANLLEEFVKQRNGKLIAETLRISDLVDLSSDVAEHWAVKLVV